MSAKPVLDQVRRNDRSMANTILSTKVGTGRRRGRRWSRRSKADLLAYDHCCGIHGAARERKGMKHGTVCARRRHDAEVIAEALAEVNDVEGDLLPSGDSDPGS